MSQNIIKPLFVGTAPVFQVIIFAQLFYFVRYQLIKIHLLERMIPDHKYTGTNHLGHTSNAYNEF